MNNNSLMCLLMLVIFVLMIVKICKNKKDEKVDGFYAQEDEQKSTESPVSTETDTDDSNYNKYLYVGIVMLSLSILIFVSFICDKFECCDKDKNMNDDDDSFWYSCGICTLYIFINSIVCVIIGLSSFNEDVVIYIILGSTILLPIVACIVVGIIWFFSVRLWGAFFYKLLV